MKWFTNFLYMKVQFKPGTIFTVLDCWTKWKDRAITKEAYLIRRNDKDDVIKINSDFQGYHLKNLNNLPVTNQLLKQIINAVN